jgi:predicted small secreted protein
LKKTIVITLLALVALLTGCNQGTSSEDIAKIAYKWEKARFDKDYKKQQEMIYEKGSYEVDKNAEKKDSGLKYDNMSFEIYFDEKNDQYYVFTEFKNPQGENNVDDELLFRKKDNAWKLDQDKEINRDQIKKELEREACINCK